MEQIRKHLTIKKNMNIPAINLKDGYKIDHLHQFPNECSLTFNNWTPRASRNPNVKKIIHFGLQGFIKEWLIEYWNRTFFNVPREEAVKKYKRRINNMGNVFSSFDHIYKLWDLQYLPVSIWALPEGSHVNIGIPTFVSYSTHPEFYWVPGMLETMTSAEMWKPSTSATDSLELWKIYKKYATLSCETDAHVKFQGWNFSMRGMSGIWDACVSGAASLLIFNGGDTIPAIDYLEDYYNANSDKDLICGGINATEHAVMCTSTGFYIKTKYQDDWSFHGKAEIDVFRRLITEVYPTGGVSIVSDTWSLPNVLANILPNLKEEILQRDGIVVIRPDSFWTSPVDCLCGFDGYHPKMEGLNAQELKTIKDGVILTLYNIFGGTYNNKGYIVLNPKVGTIYGDGINADRVEEICKRLLNMQFASSNWVGGIGSYFYQYVTRDNYGWAQKCTYAECHLDNDQIITLDVFKDPITDGGEKKSAKGLLAVYEKDGNFVLKEQASWEEVKNCAFVNVFHNSKLVKECSYSDIIENIQKIKSQI